MTVLLTLLHVWSINLLVVICLKKKFYGSRLEIFIIIHRQAFKTVSVMQNKTSCGLNCPRPPRMAPKLGAPTGSRQPWLVVMLTRFVVTEVVAVLKGHTGLVKGVTWDPVGKYLASQSDDKSLRIWRTVDWQEETIVEKPFKKVSCPPGAVST